MSLLGRVEEARELDEFMKLAKLSGWDCGWTTDGLGIWLTRDITRARDFFGAIWWLAFVEQKGWTYIHRYDLQAHPSVPKTVSFEKGIERLRKVIKDIK
jgi:hypothetical protein